MPLKARPLHVKARLLHDNDWVSYVLCPWNWYYVPGTARVICSLGNNVYC